MKRLLLELVAVPALMMLTASAALACSVCVTGANDPTLDGYRWSIIFLMVSPYLVVGSVAGWLVYQYRRAVAKRDRAGTEESLVGLALDEKESAR